MANVSSKYKAEMQQVVRALTAAALSFIVAEALAVPQSYWAVITALIIVQGSLGGTLTAGLDRLAGTLAGAALGATAALARDFWDAPQVLLLLLAVAPVTPLATIRPSFRVAPVTAAIVLFATPSNASPIVRRCTASLRSLSAQLSESSCQSLSSPRARNGSASSVPPRC